MRCRSSPHGAQYMVLCPEQRLVRSDVVDGPRYMQQRAIGNLGHWFGLIRFGHGP